MSDPNITHQAELPRNDLTPVASALRRYKEVFVSGLVVASVLALFRYLSGPGASEFTKFQDSLTSHAVSLPWFIVDIAVFVLGLSVAVSIPWGPVLRKHVIKPLLELLLHNFGIAAGFICVIWVTDPSSRTLATGPRYAALVGLVEILLLVLGFFIAAGVHICEHGIGQYLSAEEIDGLGPRIRRVSRYLALPAGGFTMWLAYQDILRLLHQVSSGH